MVRRHNARRYTKHKKEVIRPTYERIAVEIFSYEHKLSRAYLPYIDNLDGTNLKKVNQRSLRCYTSNDGVSSYILELPYLVQEEGYYRIDILYENKDANDYMGEIDISLVSTPNAQLYSNVSKVNQYIEQVNQLNEKLKSVSDADKSNVEKEVKKYTSTLAKTRRIEAEDMFFDGEKNITKRKTLYKKLSEVGEYKVTIELPPNVLFIGGLIRKLKIYEGDNLDSVGTNLMLTSANISKSGQVKPMEARFEVGYDNSFECDLTRTGLYFDYADEVNIYVKENAEFSNNEMI